MSQGNYSLEELFAQLGLEDDPRAISRFLRQHRGLPANVPLAQANFWNPSQALFLQEAIETDAEWCEVVDELDALLRFRG